MAFNKIIIRKAFESDFDSLEKINQTSSNSPYQSFALKRAISTNTCFCAINDTEQIMGWMAIAKGFELIDILYITTANEFKRQGVSKQFLNFLREEFPKSEIMLEVRKSNQAAINLYESFGMTFIDTRKNYYINPKEDALIFKYYL